LRQDDGYFAVISAKAGIQRLSTHMKHINSVNAASSPDLKSRATQFAIRVRAHQ
jgi:hypothetical protein